MEKILWVMLQSKTMRNFFVTSGGTVINGFLGLIFYVIVARYLGPADYGIMAVGVALIAMLADIFDLGMDTGLLRFVSKYRKDNPQKSLAFIKLALKVKLLIWISVFFIGWLLSPFVSQTVLLKPELSLPLQLSLIGVGGAMVFSLMTHAIQAYEKFWIWNIINVTVNGIRLLALGVLIMVSALDLPSAILLYISLPFLGFFLSLVFLPKFLQVKAEQSIKSELFHYSKWVAVVGIFAAISAKLDTFLSARLLSSYEVGIYSAANQLTIVIPQLIFALATVVAPKIGGMSNKEEVTSYLKKAQLLVSAIFVGGLLVIPLAAIVIPAIYGASYQNAVAPFMILFIAQLVFLLALPSHQAIYYYFAKPVIFSWVSILQFIVVVFIGWLLISRFGIIGAAATVFFSQLLGFVIPVGWVMYQFRKS